MTVRVSTIRVATVPWRLVLTVTTWVGVAWFAWFLGGFAQGGDAAIEYAVNFPPDYSASDILTPTYNYSPAFAFWVQPLQTIPWQAFLTLTVAAELFILSWIITPALAVLLVLVHAPLVYSELLHGQMNLLVAGLVLIGFRHPWAYAPLLLTKVTPGVGLVWFAVRREWRNLAIAMGATVLLAIPALVLAPTSWMEWISTSILGNVKPVEGLMPLMVRAPLAAGLIAWGAWTDRPWTVPLGIAMSTPLNGMGWIIALAAVPLLVKPRPSQQSKSTP